jgi:hypothetical protein
MTDEVEYGCEHPIYQGIIRDVWEKESVWHRDTGALRCEFFNRKLELRESMKIQVILQWAKNKRAKQHS